MKLLKGKSTFLRLSLSIFLTALILKGYCQKTWQMGIGGGAHYSTVLGINNLNEDESPINAIGYRIGITGETEYKARWSVNPKAEFLFNGTRIKNDSTSFLLNPVCLDMAYHFKWYSTNRDWAILIGPNLRLPLSKREHYYRFMDLSIDVGIARNRPRPLFTSSIELRYSAGLLNRFHGFPGDRSGLIHYSTLVFYLQS